MHDYIMNAIDSREGFEIQYPQKSEVGTRLDLVLKTAYGQFLYPLRDTTSLRDQRKWDTQRS